MVPLNSHARDLADFWKSAILWDSPMAQFSSFKVGGPAEAVVSAADTVELQKLIRWLQKHDISWWLIGRGSNILVPDEGLAGVVIVLEGEFRAIEKCRAPSDQAEEQTVLIRAGGGCLLSRLVHYCTAQGLSGLEFGGGIPGSVGGAVVMNAGAWGQEIGSLVESVMLMDGSGGIFSEQGKNLGFSYRRWAMPPKTVLLSATFRLAPGSPDDIQAACRKYLEERRRRQPLAEPSAGSFFKNPPDDSAGRLIEKAGLKGLTIGGAKISEKHANFIVNTGTALAADILNLMQVVQRKVYENSGVRLEPEVHILQGD